MVDEKREEIPLTKLMETILPYQASVYVTVLNIIQCIAFAFWINEARDYITKEEFSLAWALCSAVALAMILVVWHRYVNEVQYLWIISWSDTFAPFLMGITECIMVFFINPKVISLDKFVFSMILLQFLASFIYESTYRKRAMKITEKLYQTFYSDYPKFVSCLMNFLQNYDRWHFKIFTIYAGISLALFIIIISFPNNWNEVIFPIVYLVEFVGGEALGNFQKSLHNDKSVGPYFS
ncbi:MAG: hypothetical protein HY005_01110 [Candidatus Staskawiczbacteria bacterium]|nr:hypothetical protein [Candidatus Staskawiczbacteria bacterium]MBI3337205.1 hypothetical protein [Candidatus Staskawiczbacteria bacterium]